MFKLPAQLHIDDAAKVSAALVAAVRAGERQIDCGQLVSFDSGALAALLDALRAVPREEAVAPGVCPLKMHHVPENLLRLARLCGVDTLLFPTGAAH
jgi:ABC-type transporter Mla MlaB component